MTSGKKVTPVEILIVGAGFAGLYMLYTARRRGLTARVIEAAGGVGGTWYHNRYPGARVDIQSMEYSFGFSDELQQEWRWTERYAGQPELLRYANHVADRFELRDGIQLNTRLTGAVFDEVANRWRAEAESSDSSCNGGSSVGSSVGRSVGSSVGDHKGAVAAHDKGRRGAGAHLRDRPRRGVPIVLNRCRRCAAHQSPPGRYPFWFHPEKR